MSQVIGASRNAGVQFRRAPMESSLFSTLARQLEKINLFSSIAPSDKVLVLLSSKCSSMLTIIVPVQTLRQVCHGNSSPLINRLDQLKILASYSAALNDSMQDAYARWSSNSSQRSSRWWFERLSIESKATYWYEKRSWYIALQTSINSNLPSFC